MKKRREWKNFSFISRKRSLKSSTKRGLKSFIHSALQRNILLYAIEAYNWLKIAIPSLFDYNVFDHSYVCLRFMIIHGLFHTHVLKINEDSEGWDMIFIHRDSWWFIRPVTWLSRSIMTYHNTLFIDISESATLIEILQNSM